MRKMIVGILVSVLVGPALAFGQAPAPAERREDVEFFEKKVRPLLIERCHSCHSTKAKKQKGGLLLDSRESILKGGDSGPAVVPGQVGKSLLVQAIRYEKDHVQMPPKGKLPLGELAILEEWVKRGAVYPGPVETATMKGSINLVEARKFWSFQPPRVMPLPPVRDSAWPQRRIDTFILAEQEKHQLAPSPRADRRTLIRRASFDLIGLPPTPEEVEAFVNDPRPDAYERLVERLLASPQHGERWARFWLDLVRYCDVAESWAETKGQAWLYRDWVVQALNDDLPFDQFVQRQLAADLMPELPPRDRAALGFLGLSPTYWKELKLDPDVIKAVVAEEWEERIHALGSTFLGLTLACARCHDHKFDPVSMHDYYALAGVFASTRQADLAVVPEAQVAPAQQARVKVRSLQDEMNALQSKKAGTPEAARQIAELSVQIDQLKRTPGYDIPAAPGVVEASQHVMPDGPHKTKLEYKPGMAQNVALQVRGNPTNTGPMVARRFLAVLSADAPKPFTQGSGRLELARAIITEGAPLSARVIVNRVWKHHFGTGLVETPSDFGVQGSRPSHPELLDDLTARFLANGWSLKWLHREIMLSVTYQQTSAHDDKKHALDPDNRRLWRMNRRRLEVEAWRDAMLAVSGTLVNEHGGAPMELGDPRQRRRTIYGTVKRRELHDLLRLHDFPDPTTHSASRIPTTTPLQQLYTLNSPFVQQQSAALVKRLQTEAPQSIEARVRRAYQLLYGRAASDAQVKLATEFLGAGRPGAPIPDEVWQTYAQVLLGSNEFLFVD